MYRRTGPRPPSPRWRLPPAVAWPSPAGCAGRRARSATGWRSRPRRRTSSASTVSVEDDARGGEPHRAPARQRRRGGLLRLRHAAHLLQPEGQPPADPGAGARHRPRARGWSPALVDLFASDGGGSPLRHRMPGAAVHHHAAPLDVPGEPRILAPSTCARATEFEVKVWSGVMTGRILHGATPLDLIEAYTDYAGRMRPLPDWVHQGDDRAGCRAAPRWCAASSRP